MSAVRPAGPARPAPARGGVVDLTHTLTPEFPLFPAYDPAEVQDKFTVAADGFFVRTWRFDEHSGTHVDAPAHFAADGTTVDRIDPAELVLPVAVLDVRERAARDDDHAIGPGELRAWEARHGRLPERCALFAITGWAARAGEPAAYLNRDAAGVQHTPGFGADLTEWLKAERPGVRAIGLDTASLDIGATTEYPAHASWLPTGRYGIENLKGLDRLPPVGATVVVGAPKLLGGSGGPARILALLP